MSPHVNKLWPHVGKDLDLLFWWRSFENFCDVSVHLNWYRKRKFKSCLTSQKFFKIMEYGAVCTALWAFARLKLEKRWELAVFWVNFSCFKAINNGRQTSGIDSGGKTQEIRLFTQRTEPLSIPLARSILWRIWQHACSLPMFFLVYNFLQMTFLFVLATGCHRGWTTIYPVFDYHRSEDHRKDPKAPNK